MKNKGSVHSSEVKFIKKMSHSELLIAYCSICGINQMENHSKHSDPQLSSPKPCLGAAAVGLYTPALCADIQRRRFASFSFRSARYLQPETLCFCLQVEKTPQTSLSESLRGKEALCGPGWFRMIQPSKRKIIQLLRKIWILFESISDFTPDCLCSRPPVSLYLTIAASFRASCSKI